MKKIVFWMVVILLTVSTAACLAGNYGTFTFGHYEQDDRSSNGQEPLEWLILSEDSDSMLLITKELIDLQLYNIQKVDITWETSALRSWLNNEFLNTAFTPAEREAILETTNTNPDEQGEKGGRDTKDLVFCLSSAEVEKYFPVKADRAAKPTAYVANQDEMLSTSKANGWWLRSPSHYNGMFRTSCDVYSDGTIGIDNFRCQGICVRPVIRVSKKQLNQMADDSVPKPSSSASLTGQKVSVADEGLLLTLPSDWWVFTKGMSDLTLSEYGLTASQVDEVLDSVSASMVAFDPTSFFEMDIYSVKVFDMDLGFSMMDDEMLDQYGASYAENFCNVYGVKPTSSSVYRTKDEAYIRFEYTVNNDSGVSRYLAFMTMRKGKIISIQFNNDTIYTQSQITTAEAIVNSIIWK